MTQNALRFYSKPWSLSLARNCGIPVPDTWTDSCDDLQFPVFTKPQFEGGAGTRKIARSRDELPGDVDMIYQEYIDSPGTYGVGFIADSGKMLHTIRTMKRVTPVSVDRRLWLSAITMND